VPSALPGRPRVFRDPVHGDIAYPKGRFQELIEAVLGTALFQRLRHIRQNGVLHLVFHGAEHSRFSHAMGTAWVAGQMFDAAYRNTANAAVCEEAERDREDTILAALLHDVGHGPFSHTLEEILRSLAVEFDHETMTLRILGEETSEIARLLGQDDGARPARLLPFIDKKRREPPRWFYSIVSSSLDADRLDYLLRDSMMAGVWTHRFDLHRLVEALGVRDAELVVDVRARDIIESYLLALDQMYASVYFHHANRAASSLLRAVILRAVDLGRESPEHKAELFPRRYKEDDPLWRTVVEGDRVPLEVYGRLDEPHVWNLIALWCDAPDPTLAELATALRQRRFPKVITIHRRNAPLKSLGDLEQRACERFRRKRPDRDPRYYVHADKPMRRAYTGGSFEEGYAGAIKLLHDDGRWEAVEESDRSVARLIRDKVAYPSLIVPEDLRDEIQQLLEEAR
jgi:HD superfamily phosphohydrolase